MQQVFISSLARGDMGEIRKAAGAAVESLDMRAVMFETGAASDDSSRRALLDRLARCDAVVLLLGAEYGEAVASGVSPTEEEFNEARERGVPILALVQRVDREPAQDAFLRRVRGPWESGKLTADFTDASDVGLAVVRALNNWRSSATPNDSDRAAERVAALARGDERSGSFHGGSKLRVVAAPLTGRPLIDAVSLRDARLPDDLAGLARTARLAPQSMGIDASVGRDSVTLALSGGRGFESLALTVGFDGAVVAEGPVGGDDRSFGGSVVMAERARTIIERAAGFADAVWRRIDARDEIRQALMTCAVPESEHKLYALEPVGGSMTVPMGLPHVLVAPEQPLLVRREDVTRTETIDRLEAELRRAFEAAGAVHPLADRARGRFWA